MVVLLLDDRFITDAQVERERVQPTAKSPPCQMVYLCAFPLAVVTLGAVLVGMGLWSASLLTRKVLTTAGMAVYIIGVVYFVIMNLLDRSRCKQDGESDIGEGINEFWSNESGGTFDSAGSATCQELCMLETVI